MSNYWSTLRHRKFSRRTMLGASAKAGVGAAGLALVGCGDDDDDAAAIDTSAVDAAASDAAAAASAASDAAEAAGRAAEAAESASALAAEAAASEDAEQAAAAAQAAADAAADAAAAAEAAGDAGAAAVAQAAADAAEAAAQAAREAGAEDTAAGAAAAQAAAEAAAAAAAGRTGRLRRRRRGGRSSPPRPSRPWRARRWRRKMDDMGAAAGEIDTEATVRLALAADNGGLDPHRSGSQVNYQNSHGVFERSVNVNPDNGNPAPNLLTWELPDEVTWNFTVKDNVFFHNGQQLSAEDVVFSHERVGGIAEYHGGGETSDHPGGWASARIAFGAQKWASYGQTDDLHWTLSTNGPDATIPGSALSVPYVMSKADTVERGDAAVDASSMGSGYMKFVSHAEDTDFVFDRNDDYHIPWSATPTSIAGASYRRQVHLVRPEPLSRVAGMEAGEIDVAYSLTPDVVEPILDDPDFHVGTGWAFNPNQYLKANWLIPELNGGPNPFLDERVRKALNHAIDKQAIIDNLMTGEEGFSYTGWRGSAYYPQEALEAIGPYEYDPDLARALLAEAGYPDGFSTPFHFGIGHIPTEPQVALVIQQDLAAVGVELDMRSYPASEFFAMMRTKEQPGIYFFHNGAIYEPDVMIASQIAPDEGGTYAIQVNPDLDDLRDRTRTALDPEDRAQAIEDLYVAHYKIASYVYLTERFAYHATVGNVEWPLGPAQIADMHNAHQVNVRST